jgi:hypothetical protein
LVTGGNTSSQNAGAVVPGSGATTFASLPPGAYNAVVQSVPSGYTRDITPRPVTLPLSSTTSAPSATLNPLAVVPQGTLSVTVTGIGGTPLNNATVTVTASGVNVTGNTGVGGTGVASIPNLDAGAYNFVVSATGYDSSTSAPATITPATTTSPATVALAPSFVTLTVTVNGEGAALATAGTVVDLRRGGTLQGTQNTSGGTAVFANVRPESPSTYTVDVVSPGYTGQSGVAVTVGVGPTGATKTVNLLAAPVSVAVAVTGLVGTDPAVVEARTSGGLLVGTSPTINGDGTATVSVAMTGLAASVPITFTLVSAGYTSTSDTKTLTRGQVGATASVTATRNPLTVVITGLNSDGKTITFHPAVGPDVVATITSSGATMTGLVRGVVYTILIANRTVFTPTSYTPTAGAVANLTINVTS